MQKTEETVLGQNDLHNNILNNILGRREVGIVAPALMLFIFFSIFSDNFLSEYNMFNISRNLSFNIFIALGQAVVIAIGGMNLSVGAIGGMSTIVVGHMLVNMGMPAGVAVICGLAIGVIAGLLNGLIITKLKLNSFIVTLSTSFLFTGLVYGVSKGYPYTNIPKSFTTFGRGSFLGLPIVLWLLSITLICLYYLYKHTVLGRRLLATGGNENAARLSGINTNRMIVIANMLSGFFAALTGVLYVSRMGSAQPATGQNWMVISFAVAIIGGTKLGGGVITSGGLLAGGIIMVLIKNGLILMEANVYFEQAFLGLIILFTVSLDSIKGLIKSHKNKRRN
ncbi:MAG: ABC transporter permease [Spirochaetaceae bacterium]